LRVEMMYHHGDGVLHRDVQSLAVFQRYLRRTRLMFSKFQIPFRSLGDILL